MKVAVAIANPALEREVIAHLQSHQHQVVRRCLDEHDVAALGADVVLYADANFHLMFPRSILVRNLNDLATEKPKTTHTIGVTGPPGSPGVSTFALNLAYALQATIIDAAPCPSLSSMTGSSSGSWHGVEIYLPPTPPLQTLMSEITRAVTVIDFGSSDLTPIDELIVVVAAHPLSIERYLARAHRYPEHFLVVNLIEKGRLSQTALAMLQRAQRDMNLFLRDDRSCEKAFVEAKPIALVGPKSGFTKSMTALTKARFPTLMRDPISLR